MEFFIDVINLKSQNKSVDGVLTFQKTIHEKYKFFFFVHSGKAREGNTRKVMKIKV
jgi:hypothetical protein